MSDQFLGEMRMISWNFAPRFWAFCDGAAVAINTNQALFALLGTTFGGDGVRTFNLPDLRSRVPMGWDTVRNTNSLGQQQGVETYAVNTNEMPSHNHTFNGTKTAGNLATPGPNYWVGSYGNGFAAAPGNQAQTTPMDASTIGNAGGGQPHENRQPYLCVPFVIALSGIFPSRS